MTAKTWALPDAKHLLSYTAYWDGQWYLGIAKDGYSIQADVESNIVFLPFYPAMIKVVRTITQLPWQLAGSLVSVLAIVLAIGLLYVEVKEQWGQTIARRSIFYLLIFPSAFSSP